MCPTNVPNQCAASNACVRLSKSECCDLCDCQWSVWQIIKNVGYRDRQDDNRLHHSLWLLTTFLKFLIRKFRIQTIKNTGISFSIVIYILCLTTCQIGNADRTFSQRSSLRERTWAHLWFLTFRVTINDIGFCFRISQFLMSFDFKTFRFSVWSPMDSIHTCDLQNFQLALQFVKWISKAQRFSPRIFPELCFLCTTTF